MKLNDQLKNVKTVCINLKSRKDKKKYMKIQTRRRKIPLKFYITTKHKDPRRGCLESHLNVIKQALKENIETLLIFEDDVKFKRPLTPLKNVPEDWDMLYLGGTVHRVINKDNPNWYRVMTWTTHGYIINLTNQKLIDAILDAENYDKEIDRYYMEKIHKDFNCYMSNPMIAIQKQDYSDIEGRMVNYDFMEQTLEGLRTPEHEIIDGNYVLKLPNYNESQLPKVSIITPTYNRRKLFSMAIRNFENFNYPSEKIEWIIIDDTPEENYDGLDDILPIDDRIKYLRVKNTENKLTVAHKRNIGADKATGEIIIHMDDDDYYPPESIISRVKVLMKYASQEIYCVGSTLIGTYDLVSGKSSMSSDGPISLSEASMAYTRKFWRSKGFDSSVVRGEHKSFMEGRLQHIMDIPYSFILIGVNHNNNVTGGLRTIDDNVLKMKDSDKEANYYDTWSLETQFFIDTLRKSLKYEEEYSVLEST